MPVLLEGSVMPLTSLTHHQIMPLPSGQVHRRGTFPTLHPHPADTAQSNTPVPFCVGLPPHLACLHSPQLCQCSICRKVGGYMGSVNIMGNYNTFKILRGEDKIKSVVAFSHPLL